MALTLDERARRNAVKHNNATRRQYPLFDAVDVIPEEWFVTEDEEREHLLQWERRWEEQNRYMEILERRHARAAAHLRQLVARGCTDDELEALDARLIIYPDNSAYVLEFWRAVLIGRIDINKIYRLNNSNP